MLRIILILVIAAHGIGHILFLVSLLGIADWGQSTHSWLVTEETSARLIGSVLWVGAIIAFGAAVFGLLGQQTWWRNAAILASIISILGLLLFWANPVSSSALAALIFNIVVIVALLIVHFPSVEAVGA